LLCLITIIGVTSCRALGGPAAANPTASPSLQSPPPIPIAVLAAHGIVVSIAPPGTQTTVSQAEAATLALEQFAPGSTLLNGALMSVTKDNTPEGFCWVFSINPIGVIGSAPLPTGTQTAPPPRSANYAVVAIDASTGAVVLADAGRDPSLPDLPTLTPPSPTGQLSPTPR